MKRLFKRFLSVLMCLVFLFTFSFVGREHETYAASEYTTGTYTVKADVLNVRSGPGTSYSKVSSLPNGTWVIVTEVSGGWGYITLRESPVSGWISMDYLVYKNANLISVSYSVGEHFVSSSSGTEIRSGAGSTYKSLKHLVSKSEVNVTKMLGFWGYVTVDGTSGWVFLGHLMLTSEKETVKDIVAHGIDVSEWQGNVDWKSVKASGIDFVIMRVGRTGVKDAYFDKNFAGAKEAGLDIGIYIYSKALNVSQAKQDAESCMNWLKGKQFEYPLFFDHEDETQKKLGKDVNAEIALAFLDTVSANGYLGGYYSYSYWFSAYVNISKIQGKYECWIANFYDNTYVDRFNYAKTYGIWQYTSTGKVSGISGNVDRDVCYKDYPSIVKEQGLNGYEAAKGDINNDGKINMLDVVYMQQAVAKLVTLTAAEVKKADFDNDGQVTMMDVVTLQQYIAKIITEL